MRLAVATALLAAFVLAAGAQAVDYVHYPDSSEPAWLSATLIRFQTNLGTKTQQTEPYVVRRDRKVLRPASPAEAAATPIPSRRYAFADQTQPSTALYALDIHGKSHLIDAEADPRAGAAVSRDGLTIVFAEWVGWIYADGATLYEAPTDASTQPVRLTPDPCTLDSSTHSSLTGRCFDGSDRADRIAGTKGGDVIIAGSGNDSILGGDGQNVIEAQWGDDDIRTGSGPDQVDGGAGNDTIRTGAGSDHVVPGSGHDVVDAGSGADYVYANDGQRDVIDCGPGDDRVVADRIDVLRHCEHVTYEPPWPTFMVAA